MEGQIVARDRAGFIQYAGYPTQSIGLDLLTTNLAEKLLLIEFFQTNFTYRIGAAVFNRFNSLALTFVDAAHITHHMGEQLTVRVKAF